MLAILFPTLTDTGIGAGGGKCGDLVGREVNLSSRECVGRKRLVDLAGCFGFVIILCFAGSIVDAVFALRYF